MSTKPDFRKLMAQSTKAYAEATNAYARFIALQSVFVVVTTEQESAQKFLLDCKNLFIPISEADREKYDLLFVELETIIVELTAQMNVDLEEALNLEAIYMQTGRLAENQIIIPEL